MKSINILKTSIAIIIFLALGWLEGSITVLEPTQNELEYQKYFEEQKGKLLSDTEIQELEEKANEMLVNQSIDANSLFFNKAIFALLIAITSFIISKYLLSNFKMWSGTITTVACLIGLVMFVSIFELAIYLLFAAFSACLAQASNKALKRTAKHGPLI